MSLTLKTLIGNRSSADQAMRMIQNGRIPQSLLITGPCRLGTQEFAMAFAGSVLQGNLQNHPDLYVFRPEGKSNQYTIETIRRFNSLLPLPPTKALHKVFILFEAERMLEASSNALLKSIEEPARDAVILLVSQLPELLLPTLRSRCQNFMLRPVADQEIALWLKTTLGLEEVSAQRMARLAEGSKQRAHLLHCHADTYREVVLPLLEAMREGNASYTHIHAVAGKLAESMEAHVKRAADGEKTEEDDSLQQRQRQEKQEEGENASLLREAFHLLCMHILAYFRDLQALEVEAPVDQLYYPHLATSLAGKALSHASFPIEHVEAQIEAACALLDRFTPLKTCIEALFLTIRLVNHS